MLKFYIALYAYLLSSFNTLANPNELEQKTVKQDKTIKLGMSNALSGPVRNLGKELNKGANTYFNRLNKQGGINGTPVELISLDDGYEPSNTVVNTKQLIEQQVLALFGYIGTPTSHAIMPMLKKSQIPYLMPFTGADFLRTPSQNKNIFNLRASYYQEIEAQIEYLINVKELTKIGLIIQADEFGLSAQRAINKIFKENKLSITVTARYRRNTHDIKGALKKLSDQPIDAVIFVGTYQPFVHLIKLAHQQELDILFTSLSFIGSHNVLNKIPQSSKVLLSEVVPDPKECQWQLCLQFIEDMNSAGYDEPNRVQLEGYLNAFVFSQVAKKCAEPITRQCLTEEFKQYNYQDNNFKINFNNDSHQGLQQVYFSLSEAVSTKH